MRIQFIVATLFATLLSSCASNKGGEGADMAAKDQVAAGIQPE